MARHAPDAMSLSELAQASTDEHFRQQLANNVVSYTIDACVMEFGADDVADEI
ncbi:hypothetical protein [Acinetobacter sp. c3-l95]|uniref:hypothetical protein n=1 Tax=Acinetobacter sp. c3-l95 TaxID=3342804 RepID=UPI0035B998B9